MASYFNEKFEVEDVEDDVFEKVSRIHCRGVSYETRITLDVNTMIYPIRSGETYKIVITKADQYEGGQEETYFSDLPPIADDFELVMHGRVYKSERLNKEEVQIYASFGGLLLLVEGRGSSLRDLEPDMNIYLLMSKL